MNRRLAPSVHAGSMADIAFLLLIFFLVTTTIQTNSGISKKLPPKDVNASEGYIKNRNLFEIELNRSNELLVEGVRMQLSDLKDEITAFIDNGGGQGKDVCTYCKGARTPYLSENPIKAVISITHSRETSYSTYISVQNEILNAYAFLRNREAQRLFGRTYAVMVEDLRDVHFSGDREVLKTQIQKIRDMYPEKILEPKPIVK